MQKVLKFHIKTYGCLSNIRDSQNINAILESLGFLYTSKIKDADIIIINSCSIRQKSEDKVYGLGIKDLKSRKRLIFLVGCMVGSSKGTRKRYDIDLLKKKMPWVDYYLSNDEMFLIPSLLKKSKLITNFDKINNININSVYKDINPKFSNDTNWTYVSISSGCDNFCTYCVVPYARGSEVSRKEEDIIKEVKFLSEKGNKNIMLVAQNVNSYNLDTKTKMSLRANTTSQLPFVDLLKRLHDIKEVEKIGFMSSNPFDFSSDLVKTLKLPKIDRYIHIAVQSGNDEILKKMNRRHTIKEYIDLICSIREVVPEMEIGTDIIVGFPAETEDQFMDTVKLVEKLKFNNIYISTYSKRIGTNAAKFFIDDIPLVEKKRRHAYLSKIWESNRPNRHET